MFKGQKLLIKLSLVQKTYSIDISDEIVLNTIWRAWHLVHRNQISQDLVQKQGSYDKIKFCWNCPLFLNIWNCSNFWPEIANSSKCHSSLDFCPILMKFGVWAYLIVLFKFNFRKKNQIFSTLLPILSGPIIKSRFWLLKGI